MSDISTKRTRDAAGPVLCVSSPSGVLASFDARGIRSVNAATIAQLVEAVRGKSHVRIAVDDAQAASVGGQIRWIISALAGELAPEAYDLRACLTGQKAARGAAAIEGIDAVPGTPWFPEALSVLARELGVAAPVGTIAAACTLERGVNLSALLPRDVLAIINTEGEQRPTFYDWAPASTASKARAALTASPSFEPSPELARLRAATAKRAEDIAAEEGGSKKLAGLQRAQAASDQKAADLERAEREGLAARLEEAERLRSEISGLADMFAAAGV